MHKILFLSFEFHPVQSTGNFRPAKFTKYFEECGIEPVIVCGEIEDLQQYYTRGKLNSRLLEEIPKEINIFRPVFKKQYKPRSKYFQFLYYADPVYQYWKINAKKKIAEVLKIHPDIKAVFVTVPPFSVNELAYWISKKYRLPLIVDLRDAWSDQGQYPYFTRFHYLINRYYEKRLLNHANKIIVVTEGLKKIYETSNPGIAEKNFVVVYNNFDNYTFHDTKVINSHSVSKQDKYIIGYIGSFYYDITADKVRKQKWWMRRGVKKFFYYAVQEEWIYRSPYFLFAALDKIFRKYPDLKSKIFFGYIGITPDWLNSMASEFNLKDNIICYGFSKVDELKNIVNDFSALLLTTEKISGDQSFCLPSKTFDYIKYDKPIIGMVKEGDMKEFLKGSKMAVIIDPDKLNEEISKLEELILSDRKFFPDSSYVEQFHAKQQTAILSKHIIEAIVANDN